MLTMFSGNDIMSLAQEYGEQIEDNCCHISSNHKLLLHITTETIVNKNFYFISDENIRKIIFISSLWQIYTQYKLSKHSRECMWDCSINKEIKPRIGSLAAVHVISLLYLTSPSTFSSIEYITYNNIAIQPQKQNEKG